MSIAKTQTSESFRLSALLWHYSYLCHRSRHRRGAFRRVWYWNNMDLTGNPSGCGLDDAKRMKYICKTAKMKK